MLTDPNVNRQGLVTRVGAAYERDVAIGFNQETSFATAAGLGTIPNGARWALIEVEAQPVRWRDDGTNPSTTVGQVLNPGDVLPYNGSDLTKFKAIETAAGAKLNISFYR